MHKIQQKLLELSERYNLLDLSLRRIGELIGEKNSPQKIKHHLEQLKQKGLLVYSIDKKTLIRINKNITTDASLISLPIYGTANCGEALSVADNEIQDYLRISKNILGDSLIKKIKNLFVLKAVGNSMNRANISNNSIEDGDYVIVDKEVKVPENKYIVSIINGCANIKKFFLDKKNKQIILMSESFSDIAPIYIHEDDIENYSICGEVVKVLKQPENFNSFECVSASDTLKVLGEMSKEEENYYRNL